MNFQRAFVFVILYSKIRFSMGNADTDYGIQSFVVFGSKPGSEKLWLFAYEGVGYPPPPKKSHEVGYLVAEAPNLHLQA